MSTKEDYARRVEAVVRYVNDHFDENMDMERLAAVSHLSKWHFQRIMKAFLGEPLGAYIQRVRVETAARLLRDTDLTVSEIAWQVGYDTPSSLSKVFQQFCRISPSEYRNNKNYTIMKPIRLSRDLKLKAPEMVELEPRRSLFIELTGPYRSLDFAGTWRRLRQFAGEKGIGGAGTEYIAIYQDDPRVTEESLLRTDLCLVPAGKAEPEGDIGVRDIAGGRYAKFVYTGPYENLGAVYDAIYGKWLPENGGCSCDDCCTPYSNGCPPECECGCTLRDSYCFEKYLNDPENTTAEKLVTEIYVPVK